MAPKVKVNKEFARWFGTWTARIEQGQPPGKTASAKEQRHPPVTDTTAEANEAGLPETCDSHH
jgi:hypothetical protein